MDHAALTDPSPIIRCGGMNHHHQLKPHLQGRRVGADAFKIEGNDSSRPVEEGASGYRGGEQTKNALENAKSVLDSMLGRVLPADIMPAYVSPVAYQGYTC
jgi:hypothetical protein